MQRSPRCLAAILVPRGRRANLNREPGRWSPDPRDHLRWRSPLPGHALLSHTARFVNLDAIAKRIEHKEPLPWCRPANVNRAAVIR